jgi:hypothetical protein
MPMASATLEPENAAIGRIKDDPHAEYQQRVTGG